MFKKLTAALASTSEVNAGPLAYGICQTGCNAVAAACYAAAGAVFGTVTGGIAGELFEIRVPFHTCLFLRIELVISGDQANELVANK
ncbi:hypothetical protein PC128_g5441 [Phytophthora cactorum]|nr:hypothetical protein PC128_g5441 [Phytophthora cactorum]